MKRGGAIGFEKECFERLVTLLERFRGMPGSAIACNLCLRPTSMAFIVASQPMFSSSRRARTRFSSPRNATVFRRENCAISRGHESDIRGHCTMLLSSLSFLNIADRHRDKFVWINSKKINRHATFINIFEYNIFILEHFYNFSIHKFYLSSPKISSLKHNLNFLENKYVY